MLETITGTVLKEFIKDTQSIKRKFKIHFSSVSIDGLFSQNSTQISTLSDFSSNFSSKFLSALWLAGVENLNLNPELWLAARNLEEK